MVASELRKEAEERARKVLIPFIAGQWSLHSTRRRSSSACASLNPLHCGAVVASHARRMAGVARGRSLNPLHCGAVVASDEVHALVRFPGLVLIPFIAGQWSLLGKEEKAMDIVFMS